MSCLMTGRSLRWPSIGDGGGSDREEEWEGLWACANMSKLAHQVQKFTWDAQHN